MTAKNKKSFLMHIDSLSVLDDLTDDQAGQLFKAILAYQKGDEINLNPIVKIAFSPFKNQFKRDNEKYEKTCEMRAKAGAKGGKAKAEKEKQDLANASKSKQDLANLADNKNKNKNKTNNKSESDSELISKLPTKAGEQKTKMFVPPTLEEVTRYMGDYALSKQKTISPAEPEKFINFYESKGWLVGSKKMVSWQASVRGWVGRIETNQQQQRPTKHGVDDNNWVDGLINGELL